MLDEWTIISGTLSQRFSGWSSWILKRPIWSGWVASYFLRHRGDDAGIDRVGDGDRLEGRAQLVDRLGGVVLERLDPGLARIVGIEGGQRGHRDDLAGAHVEHEALAAGRRELVHCGAELGFQRRLHAAVDRQRHRRAARRGIEQALVEHLLHAERALAVDVGPAEHMRGERRLGIEALGLAGERDRRLADRVDLRPPARASRGGADR